MKRLIYILIFMMSGMAFADDHCSLKVLVRSSERHTDEPTIVVELASGRKIRRRPIAGVAEFCELGVLPVTVTLESNCNRPVIKDVELQWGKTAVLEVFDKPCLRLDFPPSTACTTVLMARDSDGVAIRNAVFDSLPPFEKRMVGDSFGRLHTAVGFGKTVEMRVSAVGFQSRQITLRCTKTQTIEEDVVLPSGALP